MASLCISLTAKGKGIGRFILEHLTYADDCEVPNEFAELDQGGGSVMGFA